ncbi:unnamed protein product, partial [Urochloa humidicola]
LGWVRLSPCCSFLSHPSTQRGGSRSGRERAMVVSTFTGPGIGIGFGVGCGFGVGWGFGGMPLNMFGLGIGGGCGVGLGLGWGFGNAYGCQYRSSRVQFQGIEFHKKTEGNDEPKAVSPELAEKSRPYG